MAARRAVAAGLASLGCGNPTVAAELSEGETVLDLGSGGGIPDGASAPMRPPREDTNGPDLAIFVQ